MWFDFPPRKYTNFPRKLVGFHKFRFRNTKGQFKKFRKGSRYTLYIEAKSPQAFLVYLLWLQYPDAKPQPRKKPAKAPARTKAKRKPSPKPKPAPKPTVKAKKRPIKAKQAAPRTQARRGYWTHAQAVLEYLEARYPNIEMDPKAQAMKGYRYEGKGGYNKTFWPNPKITPYVVNSMFAFVVKNIGVVSPKIGDPDRFVLAVMHIEWEKTNTDEIVRKLSEPYTEERRFTGDEYITLSRKERLINMLFAKGGGEASIMEVVGFRFATMKAPKRNTNPKRRYKKRKK
jgi:hypothetical protein